MEKTIL